MSIEAILKSDINSTKNTFKSINETLIFHKKDPMFYNSMKDFYAQWYKHYDDIFFLFNNITINDHFSVEDNKKLVNILKKSNTAVCKLQEFLPPTTTINKKINFNTHIDMPTMINLLKESIEHLSSFISYHTLISSKYSTNSSAVLADFEEKTKQLEKELENLHAISEDDLKKISNYIVSVKKESSLGALGASFEKRSQDLEKLCDFWLLSIKFVVFFILISSAYTLVTVDNIDYDYDKLNFFIRKTIFYIPLFIATFWYLWFTCKQYTESCCLRDDYHYKHDISLAFYGYNEEVKKLSGDNKELQLALLDIVLKNIGTNPVNNKRDDCNSPYAEMIKQSKEPLNKISDIANNLKNAISHK